MTSPAERPADLCQLLETLQQAGEQPGEPTWQLLQRVRQLARRRLPPHSLLRAGMDSEDLAQEVWLHLVRVAPQFRGSTWPEFFAFVDAVLGQRTTDAARRATVRRRELTPALRGDQVDDLVTNLPSPSAIVGEDDQRQKLLRLIEQLPPTYRDPLRSRLDGRDTQSIAHEFDLSPAATRQRLSRALQMLKELWPQDAR